jgi:hypothetical protein
MVIKRTSLKKSIINLACAGRRDFMFWAELKKNSGPKISVILAFKFYPTKSVVLACSEII